VKQQLDKLAEVLERRVKGDWQPEPEWEDDEEGEWQCHVPVGDGIGVTVAFESTDEGNAHAICAAVNTAPQLLDVARHADLLVRTLEKLLTISDGQVVVEVNGERVAVDLTGELKTSLQALGRRVEEVV
jgi:hypothetical protein